MQASGKMHIFILLLLLTAVTMEIQSFGIDHCKRRVCYFNNNAQHRHTEETKFHPEDIDPTLCTHIIYYSAQLHGNDIVSTQFTDITTRTMRGNYEKVTNLKTKEKGLKVLLTVDGKECKRKLFYTMANNEKSRVKFAENVIMYLRKHNFDGVDLRCVCSEKNNVAPEVKNALTETVKELRTAFDTEDTVSPKLLLIVTAYGEKAIDNNCYDVPGLSSNVDWINLWVVDLHEDSNTTIGHHSPLYPELTGPASFHSVDTAVQHWIRNGAPKYKLVIALPSYGRFSILTSSNTTIGAPSQRGGTGKYSRLPGSLASYEICELRENIMTHSVYMRKQRVPYLISGNKWVVYDDVGSLNRKVIFLRKRQLGGFAFVWLDTDDFKGMFCKMGPYPLLKAAIGACNM